MMVVKDIIKECKIAQGDLVFIYHKTKPFKTGWWRKIREGSTENRMIYYILEKPMHKDFNIEKASVKSHVEKGLCIMSPMSVTNGAVMDKYEILADIRGIDSVYLSSRGYQLCDVLNESNRRIDEEKDNIVITKRFKELLELYKPQKNQMSDIETLVKGLI